MLANAQAAFDRVTGTATPPLADASACVQTQAAMLSVALPGEESELHYRKGYCELAVAAVTHAPSAFTDAAAELDRSGANMLAWLARRAGHLTDQPSWSEPDSCPKSCDPLRPVARLWKGWVALSVGDLDAATKRDEIAREIDPVALATALAKFMIFKAAKSDPGANEVAAPPGGWDAKTGSPSLGQSAPPSADAAHPQAPL